MDDKWIKIYECPVPEEHTKVWLQEILEENNISFESRVESYWVGIKIPEYKEKLVIYVPIDFKEQVQEYIDEFNNPQNILTEDIEELKIQKDYEEDEDETKTVAKKQKTMIMIYVGVVIIMIVSVFIAAMIR